jgi:hypothetical protein
MLTKMKIKCLPYISMVLFFILSGVLVGCDFIGGNKIVGTWQASGFMSTITVTYSKDHTYLMTITSLRSSSQTGSWSINGNRLSTTTMTSTFNPADVGKQSTEEIVNLTDSVLTLKSNGNVVTLTRVK